jgi:hypothetical protein
MIDTLTTTVVALASNTDWLEVWRSGDWLRGILGPFVELLGRETFVLLLGAPLSLGLWIQTQSMVVPAVILTLFMGLILGGAPPEATLIGYVVVIVATLLAYRSVSGVGTR